MNHDTERDPNPLLTLESRRHKRRISEPASLPAVIPVAAVKPSIHAEEADDSTRAKKGKSEAEGEECKENKDEGNVQLKKCKKSKKHKKKHKKKRKGETDESAEQEDLIIPVSPGLGNDNAADESEETAETADRGIIKEEPVVKMETRGSKEAVNYSGMRPFRSSFS